MKLQFDWDIGNIYKSEMKHKISVAEAESIFIDSDKLIYNDLKHSSDTEVRYICIGRSFAGKILFCYFTLRGAKIRIIGCRPANKKEKLVYEEGLEK